MWGSTALLWLPERSGSYLVLFGVKWGCKGGLNRNSQIFYDPSPHSNYMHQHRLRNLCPPQFKMGPLAESPSFVSLSHLRNVTWIYVKANNPVTKIGQVTIEYLLPNSYLLISTQVVFEFLNLLYLP